MGPPTCVPTAAVVHSDAAVVKTEDGVAGLVYRARAKEADAGDDLRGDTRGVVVEGAADEGCPFAVDGGLRGHRDAEQGPARFGEEARAEGDEHVRPKPRAAHGGGAQGPPVKK